VVYYTGDFGGMFGLLLGGSILSMVEIIDLLLYNTVVKLTTIKRVNPRPRLIQCTPVWFQHLLYTLCSWIFTAYIKLRWNLYQCIFRICVF